MEIVKPKKSTLSFETTSNSSNVSLNTNTSFIEYNYIRNKNEINLEDKSRQFFLENKQNFFKFSIISESNPIKLFTPKIIISSNSISSAKSSPVRMSKFKKGTINRADCIRKRIKTHFNQFLLRILNKKLKSSSIQTLSLLTLTKLSQNFIADVKIESNKFYISLPVNLIYSLEFKGMNEINTNQKVIENIYSSNDNDLKGFFNKTYGEFFNEYLDSEFYLSDLRKFLKKEGEEYIILYKKFSKELLDYYINGIPYKRRQFSSSSSFESS